jgi:hypothetical protein
LYKSRSILVHKFSRYSFNMCFSFHGNPLFPHANRESEFVYLCHFFLKFILGESLTVFKLRGKQVLRGGEFVFESLVGELPGLLLKVLEGDVAGYEKGLEVTVKLKVGNAPLPGQGQGVREGRALGEQVEDQLLIVLLH